MAPKRHRSEKGKGIAQSSTQAPRSEPMFRNDLASDRYTHLAPRNTISGRFVAMHDFEHLDIPQILRANNLVDFLSIREKVYTSLVPYFYANFEFSGNRIISRVMGRDINISLGQFARILHLSTDGIDVYSYDLHDFPGYPEGESSLTASTLLHQDDNPDLVRNEIVSQYTLQSQVLAKIVFHNIVPKSGEFSHARGPVPLIIYCLLKGIKINFPRVIASHMSGDQIRTAGRSLPYGMLITHLLRALDFDFSGQAPSKPSSDFNAAALKMMEAQLRRHAAVQPPPVPAADPAPAPPPVFPAPEFQGASASEVRSMIEAHQAWVGEQVSALRADMDSRAALDAVFRAEVRNDLSYMAESMRFVDVQFQSLFTKLDIVVPDGTPGARRLPATGPPFPPRARVSIPPPRPRVDALDTEEVDSSSSSDDGDDQTMAEASGDDEEEDDEATE